MNNSWLVRENKVRAFHYAVGAEIDAEWTMELLALRMNLLEEEFKELMDELTTAYACLQEGVEIDKGLKADILGEAADLQVVLSGLAVSLGLPLEYGFSEKMQSNMSKLDDDGKPIKREDGKVLKGPNYRPADMEKFFE